MPPIGTEEVTLTPHNICNILELNNQGTEYVKMDELIEEKHEPMDAIE